MRKFFGGKSSPKRTERIRLVDRAIRAAEKTIRDGGQFAPVLVSRERVVKNSTPPRSKPKEVRTETALGLELRRALGIENTLVEPLQAKSQKFANDATARSTKSGAANVEASHTRRHNQQRTIDLPPPTPKALHNEKKASEKLGHLNAKGKNNKAPKKKVKPKAKKPIGAVSSKARLPNPHSVSATQALSKNEAKRKASVAAGRLKLNKILAERASNKPQKPTSSTATEDMAFSQLRRLWIDAIKYLEKFGSDSGADDVIRQRALIEQIEAEWRVRLEMLTDGTDKFTWPTTDAPKGDGKLAPVDWHDTGMLGYLEYSVAQDCQSTAEQRHALLSRIFIGQLPPLNNHHYMQQWFVPNSAARLQKMAESLASFARNAKRKRNPPTTAIAKWEGDLGYLHDEFYKGRFSFNWPNT